MEKKLPPDKARNMRRMASLLLVVMGGIFFLAHSQQESHVAWPYVRAFAEAAMVGGLADWFAVTALFRHPMGIPIPHTAIIPQNKDRIAETMAQFLRSNFLIPSVVARRLYKVNMASAFGNFLSQRSEGETSRIREGAAHLLVELLESLDPERLGLQVKAGLARAVSKIELAPLMGQMLSAAIADGRHRPLMDGMIHWAGIALEDNEDMVRDMVQKRANALIRWTGLDGRLANSVVDGLYRLLAEVHVDPDHPMRAKAEEGLQKLAHDLQHDEALRAKVEQIKNDMLENPSVSNWWQGVWERLRGGMIATIRDPDKGLGQELGSNLAELGASLQSDPQLQYQVNRLSRRMLVGVSNRFGDGIVKIVSETVKRWDAGTITARVENAVGRDLQFIRVNGTLVGGLVGLSLHVITKFI